MLTSKQVSKKVPACLLVGLQSLKLACYLLVYLYDMIFFLAIYGVEEFKLLRQRYVGNKAHDATRYRRLKIPKLELGIGRY
jgi:hypothetical protein